MTFIRYFYIFLDVQHSNDSWKITPTQRLVNAFAFSLSLSLLLATTSILVFLSLSRRTSTADLVLGCHTSECNVASRYLNNLLDRDVGACDDFYQHVCRRWTKDSFGKGFLQDSFDRFLVKLQFSMKSFDASTLSPGVHRGLEVARRLFDSCLALMSTGELDVEAVVKSSLAVINVTRIQNSDTCVEALRRAMYLSFTDNVRAVVGIRPLLWHNVVYLHVFSEVTIQGELRLEGTNKELKRYLKLVIRSVYNRTADSFIIKSVANLDNNIMSHLEGPTTDEWFNSMDLKTEARFPAVLWEAPLKWLLQRHKKEFPEGLVLFTGYNRTLSIVKLLLSAPLKVTVAYLTIQVIAQALRFNFLKRQNEQTPPKLRLICFDAVNQALSPDWFFVARKLLFTNSELVGIQAIFDDVKRFAFVGNVARWLDNSTGTRAREELDYVDLTTHLSAYDSFAKVSFDFTEAEVPDKGFIANYLTLQRSAQRQFLMNTPSALRAGLSYLEAKGRAVYSERHRTVFLPLVLQHSPVFYASNVPASYNYGTLGAILAKEISEAVSPFSGLGKGVASWWTKEALREFSYRASCYRGFDDASRRQVLKDVDRMTPQFLHSMFVWLRSARVSYESMAVNFKGSSAGKALIHDQWRKAQKTFFLRFCLISCSLEHTESLTPREKCMWPVLNMPEFGDAFGCPPTSFMRSRQKCHLL